MKQGSKAARREGRKARADRPEGRAAGLALLHLCDSLFPIGGFAYSDGLETATTLLREHAPAIADAEGLRGWIDVCLDESFARMEGPAVWQAWPAFRDADWNTLVTLDEELTALRPSSSGRRSSRAMGRRLLTTWQTLHPDPRIEHALTIEKGAVPLFAADGSRKGVRPLFQEPQVGPALPIAFAGACACSGIDRRRAVEAFAYTRLAATISAAMRLMPIGQTDAHALLARTLERVPAVVELIAIRDARVESFAPAVDIAAMTQQYVHSRLFRS
jgi:urease accessory protein